MATKERAKNNRPRNLVLKDGYTWYSRAGQLWGDYRTAAGYIGCTPSSFPCFVWRHNLKTIKHGRNSLVSKYELDKKTGALSETSNSTFDEIDYLPVRGRKRLAAHSK